MEKEKKVIRLNIGWDNSKLDTNILNNICPDVKLYLIMRCPYSRICSFYQDKFVECFKSEPKKNTQLCQNIMYKYYSEETISTGNFSISDMISAIKDGYFDDHIRLQTDILKHNIFVNEVNIIKLEDLDFNTILKSILGYDMPHMNSSGGEKIDMLTPELKEFLYEYYKPDFDLYNK